MKAFREYLLQKGFKPTTIRDYERRMKQIRLHFNFSQHTSSKELMKVIAWCRQKQDSPRTINASIRIIGHYLDSIGVIHNPCRYLRVKGVFRKQVYELFTPQELDSIYERYKNYGKVAETKHKRNLLVLGLVIYQGLTFAEILKIELTDVKLEEGRIYIPATNRTNSRTMSLLPFQIISMYEYITVLRCQMMSQYRVSESEYLFVKKTMENNLMSRLRERVHHYQPRLKKWRQIRASVITNWLKTYNLREVQYMAGHKYVTTTESYCEHQTEQLKEQITRHHPLEK